MALSDAAIRKATPADKPMRLFDGGGLYLEISPSGSKLWRLKYRFAGKEKRLALGIYPDVSLAGARERRGAHDTAHRPPQNCGQVFRYGVATVQRTAKADRATNSYEAVAREWLAKYSPRWAASHSEKIVKRLGNDVFPWIGAQPIAGIAPPDVLKVLNRIEGRGAHDT
jgi:hypothetical protein